MTDIDHTAGDTARDKRPTALKGLFFFIILLLVCGGLVLAATQLRSKEGPKVATVAPEPMAVQVAPVELPRESGRQIGRKLPSAKQCPQGQIDQSRRIFSSRSTAMTPGR